MKATLTVLGVTLELEATDEKELWQKIAFYQSLPTVCPIDDTPTRFGFRNPKGNDYYEVCNSNPNYYITFHVGQNREGGTLFASGEWTWWDWQAKEELQLANWTTLTDTGQQLRQHILRGGQHTTEKAAKPTANSQQPAATKPAAPDLRVFHALGQTLSKNEGSKWDAKRELLVKNIGKKRRPAVDITSAADLTQEEVTGATLKMEKRLREIIWELAEDKEVEPEVLDGILSNLDIEGVEEATGVPLTKLYQELAALD